MSVIQYREQSQDVQIHSHTHATCEHPVVDGWECECSVCQCESIVSLLAAYAYDEDGDHKVMITANPQRSFERSLLALSPNRARALASALCFAANDAETLNKEFPPTIPGITAIGA